jgi:hypothetical protein
VGQSDQPQPEAVRFYTALPCSESAVSFHVHADVISDQIAAAVPECEGMPICLRGYTPPMKGIGPMPHGYIEICLEPSDDPNVEWAIGIFFGMQQSSGVFLRTDFDVENWAKHKTDPSGGDLYVGSFDEAWRVICLLGQKLRTPAITIGYGF